LYVYDDHTGLLADTGIPPLQLTDGFTWPHNPPEIVNVPLKDMIRKIISNLWKGQLYNAAQAHTPAGQPLGKKVSYIQIARDHLQRLVLFKPAQYLRIPHNKLPLLRLRSRTISYTSTHLHLGNIHSYTLYAERYYFSCLLLQILGNEAHAFFCTAHVPLHSLNLQSTALYSTFDDSIFGHGQPTQTPKT